MQQSAGGAGAGRESPLAKRVAATLSVTLDLPWHKCGRLYAALFCSCSSSSTSRSRFLPSCTPAPLYCVCCPAMPTHWSHLQSSVVPFWPGYCVGSSSDGGGSDCDSSCAGNGEECMLSALLSCLCNRAVVKGHMSSPAARFISAIVCPAPPPPVAHFMFYSSSVYKLSQRPFAGQMADCAIFWIQILGLNCASIPTSPWIAKAKMQQLQEGRSEEAGTQPIHHEQPKLCSWQRRRMRQEQEQAGSCLHCCCRCSWDFY